MKFYTKKHFCMSYSVLLIIVYTFFRTLLNKQKNVPTVLIVMTSQKYILVQQAYSKITRTTHK